MKKEMKKEMIEVMIKLENIKEADYDNVIRQFEEICETFCLFRAFRSESDYIFVTARKGTPAVKVMKLLMLLKIEFEVNYCKVDNNDDRCLYYKGDKGYDD